MSMPQITLPGGFPEWLIAVHEGEPDPVYAHTPMRMGHQRQRRVFRTAPERRRVQLFLTEDQAPRFHRWFEDDLLAGQRSFAARVANRGPGIVWWEARFVSDPPYQADPLHAGGGVSWRISAELLLTGDPQPFAPILTTLQAENVIRLIGSASPVSFASMSAENEIELIGEVVEAPDALLSATNDIALIGSAQGQTFPSLVAENVIELVGEVEVGSS